jgi:hypothetical protein
MPHGNGAGRVMVRANRSYSVTWLSLSTLEKTFCKIGLLDSPAPQKMTWRVKEFNTRKVSVMRFGGGLGESSIDATCFSVSSKSL